MYDEKKDSVDICQYDMENKLIQKNTEAQQLDHMFFAPRRINNQMICGGNLAENKKPEIMLDNEGFQYFDMPIIS